MKRRITLDDIPAACLPPGIRKRAKRSKYHNVHTTVGGVRFPSKKHAAYDQQLKLRIAAGELAGVIPEVSFPIGGGRRMQVDYLLIPAGTILTFHDPKGYATAEWLLKKDIAEGLYPIKIVPV